jgi:hypothetical protein
MSKFGFSRRTLLGIGLATAASTTATSALALTIVRKPSLPSPFDDLRNNIVQVSTGLDRGSASLPTPTRQVRVSNSEQLRNALSAAQPGDHIMLGSGQYQGDFTLAKSGTSDRPIVVRAQDPLDARIAGGMFQMRGDWQILYALDFVAGRCTIDSRAQSPRIWRCRFRDHPGSTQICVRVNASTDADIAYCEWNNYGGRGVSVGVNAGATRTTIRRCLFRNTPSGFRNGSAEAIQFGFGSLDAQRRSNGLVEQCRFVNWNSDDECISVKTMHCTIRQCVLENCNSNVNNRIGQYNTFEAIWIKNGRGISVSDGYNKVLGCRIESGRLNDVFHQLVATAGNLRAGDYPSSVSESDKNNAAENCVFSGNQSSSDVLIGRDRSGWSFPARSTRIRQHTGQINFRKHVNTDSRPSDSENSHSWAPLVWLNDGDVGPGANGGIKTAASAPSQPTSSPAQPTSSPDITSEPSQSPSQPTSDSSPPSIVNNSSTSDSSSPETPIWDLQNISRGDIDLRSPNAELRSQFSRPAPLNFSDRLGIFDRAR